MTCGNCVADSSQRYDLTLKARGGEDSLETTNSTIPEAIPSSISTDETLGDSVEHCSYAGSIVALCICMLTHSYLLISVFPYSAFLAMETLKGKVDEENAGKYAGLVASSFMVGRSLTSYLWGKAADRYGRTFVLYTSLILSTLFSVLFGLSPTFTLACLARFCMGASNGLIGTIKTMVSELSLGNERRESRGLSIVVGMWGWGFLIAPGVSGILAEPIKQYQWEDREGWVYDILQKHPFLLPNLLGALLCLVGGIMVRIFVRETIETHRSWTDIPQDVLKAINGYRAYQHLDTKESFSTIEMTDTCSLSDWDDETKDARLDNRRQQEETTPATMASLWHRPETRNCLLIYWAYSFVGLTLDETFPLFCVSKVAGLGLDERMIGKILSTCGLIFALCQYFANTLAYDKLGLYGAIRLGAILSAPTMFLMPVSLLFNKGHDSLEWWTFIFLALVMAVYRIFALVFFANVAVALNRTVPASQRATMNGLSMLGGSIAKALGPIFAGYLTSFSIWALQGAGSMLMFGTISVLGCGVVMSTFFVFP